MEEPGIAGVDAHVARLVAGPEENQVAGAQLVPADRLPDFGLAPGGARNLMAKSGQESPLDQAGTVHAITADAAHPVRGPLPLGVLVEKDTAHCLTVREIHSIIAGRNSGGLLKGTPGAGTTGKDKHREAAEHVSNHGSG